MKTSSPTGGQSIPAFDHYMAPGVAKTFVRGIVDVIDTKYGDDYEIEDKLDILNIKLRAYLRENRLIMNKKGYKFISDSIKGEFSFIKSKTKIENIIRRATKSTRKHTYDAMESVIANLNSMHSRAGAQVPFSSLNYGTDTSEEGRMVTECLLLTTERGLGNGETPIFPIQIYKVKEGVNFNKEDKNYDLFKLAIRVSAKRLFPKQNWGLCV